MEVPEAGEGPIGSIHPDRDFEACLEHRVFEGVDLVKVAMERFVKVIQSFLEEGEDYHPKILSCLEVLRWGCVQEQDPGAFNELLHSLRARRGMRPADSKLWQEIRDRNICPVSDKEVPTSAFSEEEAIAFLHGPGPTAVAAASDDENNEDLEDLIT